MNPLLSIFNNKIKYPELANFPQTNNISIYFTTNNGDDIYWFVDPYIGEMAQVGHRTLLELLNNIKY